MRSEQRYYRPTALLWLAALLLIGAPLLAGCLPEETDPRPFGPGNGSPVMGTSPTALLDTNGNTIGSLDYNNSYFTLGLPNFTLPADPEMGVITSPPNGIGLLVSLIAGRPDTPCRFAAAMLARDEGYTILGDGEDRINDQGVEFHEVWLSGPSELRFDCAQLTGNLGVMVQAQAASSSLLKTSEVHFVLNSIRP